MQNPSTTPTSTSLIQRAKSFDKTAWERLSTIYTPLVYSWARWAKLQEHDAADVVQEVFQAVAKGICKFEYGEGLPPFRGWLYGITRHKINDHFRAKSKKPDAAGGTEAQSRLSELPDQEPEEFSNSGDVTDRDSIAFQALELMKTDFQENTWQAFWRVTIENQAPADVAADLGMSIGAVYTAKSRVLSHLRRELVGLT